MIKVKDIVGILQTSFRANKIPEPKTSSYHVIGKSINLSQRILRRNSFLPLSLYHYNKIQKFALRRLKHEPIEYILAHRQFRGLSLKMERPVMIPKPVTEQLVDVALDLFKNHEGRFHFVDVGCGSGAISLSLLKEKPGSYGVAIDTSLPALELTVKNFKRIFGKEIDMGDRLDVIQSSFKDFADKNVHKFNLIISSPPYMPSEDLTKLGKQIHKYGDLKALDGGQYGLDVVWELIRKASDEMKNGGFLVMETNPGQPEYLEDYFRNHGNLVHNLTFYGTKEDSQFRKRFVILQKKVSKQGKDQSSAESD